MDLGIHWIGCHPRRSIESAEMKSGIRSSLFICLFLHVRHLLHLCVGFLKNTCVCVCLLVSFFSICRDRTIDTCVYTGSEMTLKE